MKFNVDVLDVQNAWLSQTPLPSDMSVETWISRAERYLISQVRDLPARIEAGRTTEDDVRDVIVDLVIDVLINRERIRTVQESNGPTSGSVTFGGDSPGKFSLTDRQLRQLGVLTTSRRKSRSVDTWR